MTNIWAKAYEEVRSPFFEMEDPYVVSEEKKKEKKDEDKKEKDDDKSSKRWWDDDGDGVGYEEGEVSGKFKKKVKKEEYEEVLDEEEGSYGATPKAYSAASKTKMTAKRKPFLKKMLRRTNPANRTPDDSPRKGMTSDDRERARAGAAHGVGTRQDHDYPSEGPGGVTKSAKKLRKQKAMGEDYVNEAQAARNNPEKYEREQEKKYAPVRGEKTPMPPRGNKRREDFEKWYRANVKEERELHSKNDKNERLDVRKGIKNKIEVNPKLKEEVEAWVSELVEEGYDLSDFTWDEVTEIYETAELDEADTTMIPPKGDAQTMKPDPLQSAKKRAAQAQVRKELSDLQVAKARATAKLSPTSEEAILSYLENRYDLSEGVFDPKKSRLKPASERRKTEMTPAQKKAAEMKQKRAERLEQEAEKILRQTRGSSTKRSSSPMGSEPPKKKEAAPEANRKLKRGQKEDKLAKAASDVLKGSN